VSAPPRTWQARWAPTPGTPGLCVAGMGVDAAARWAEVAGARAVEEETGLSVEALCLLPVEKKRRERLAGRLAARAAIRAAWPEQADERLPQLRVREDGLRAGQPYLEGLFSEPLAQGRDGGFGITLSHSGDLAMAAVGPGAVGLDLEEVAPRDEGFLSLAFTPSECTDLAPLAAAWGLTFDEVLTLHWCAKEAALKRLGVGLRAALQEIEITFSRERTPLAWTHVNGPHCSLVSSTWRSTVRVRQAPDLSTPWPNGREEVLKLGAACAGGYVYAVLWEW